MLYSPLAIFAEKKNDMPNITCPLSRWESLEICCDGFEVSSDTPASAEAVISHYESNFRMIFNTLKAKHPCLDSVRIEGLRLKPLEEFYIMDFALLIQGHYIYLSLSEVASIAGMAGIPYVR